MLGPSGMVKTRDGRAPPPTRDIHVRQKMNHDWVKAPKWWLCGTEVGITLTQVETQPGYCISEPGFEPETMHLGALIPWHIRLPQAKSSLDVRSRLLVPKAGLQLAKSREVRDDRANIYRKTFTFLRSPSQVLGSGKHYMCAFEGSDGIGDTVQVTFLFHPRNTRH